MSSVRMREELIGQYAPARRALEAMEVVIEQCCRDKEYLWQQLTNLKLRHKRLAALFEVCDHQADMAVSVLLAYELKAINSDDVLVLAATGKLPDGCSPICLAIWVDNYLDETGIDTFRLEPDVNLIPA